MMVFRTSLLMLVALAALTLSGCLESKMPLFDEAKAVTPAPAGRYHEQERRNNGTWLERLTGTLTIEAKSYSWKPDDKEGIDFFTIHDIGGGFYVAAARAKNPQPKDPYTYALFEATKDGFLSYAPTCGDLTKMRLPKEDMPTVDGNDCFFNDREKLVRALQFYAKYMLPTSRYVPIKP